MADLRPLATRVAKRYGIPVGILHGLIQQESGWNPQARNPSGATGLMQIHLPSHPDISEKQALDPRFAINWGARYLAAQHKRFGSWKLALAAYNAGPGNVEKHGGVPPFAETRNYVKNILGMAGEIKPGKPSRNTVAPSVAAAVPVPSPPAAPDFSAVAMQNVTDIASGRFDPVAALSGLTAAVASQPEPEPSFELGAMPADPVSIPNFGGKAPKGWTPGSPVVGKAGGEHGTSGLPGYTGKDYFAKAGAPAYAPVSGTVVRLSGHDPAKGAVQGAGGPLGWSVYIKDQRGRLHYLTHMGSRNVKVGQRVREGQPIGTVADYDKYGRPSHIHYGVK